MSYEDIERDEVVYEEYKNIQSPKSSNSSKKKSDISKNPPVKDRLKPLFQLHKTEFLEPSEVKEDWNKIFNLSSQHSHNSQKEDKSTESTFKVNNEIKNINDDIQSTVSHGLKRKFPVNTSRSQQLQQRWPLTDPLNDYIISNTPKRHSFPTLTTLKKPNIVKEALLDRPTHWGKQTIKYAAKANQKLSTSTSNTRRSATQNNHGSHFSRSTPSMITNMNPTNSSIPNSNSNPNIHRISFKPTWMTSKPSHELYHRNITNINQESRNDDEIIPMESRFSSSTSHHLHNSRNQSSANMNESYHNDVEMESMTPNHSFSIQSPTRYLSEDCSGISPSGKLGKPKPGSLRHRLHKIRRTMEADRMFKISMESTGNLNRSTDLRDPRNRARSWIDVQFIDVKEISSFIVAEAIIQQVNIREVQLSTIQEGFENEETKDKDQDKEDDHNFHSTESQDKMKDSSSVSDDSSLHPLKSLMGKMMPIYFKKALFKEVMNEHMESSNVNGKEMEFIQRQVRLFDPALVSDGLSSPILLCVNIFEVNN